MEIDPNSLQRVLATDCGSTTTKAVLFEKTAGGWRQTARGEAPTTVEKPVADVTIGAKNAFLEVQELSGLTLLDPAAESEGNPLLLGKAGAREGLDLYLSTSSAGGGLQMIVAGLVKTMSTASAERAALGAGAIVLDAISVDDGREQFERVQRIRHLRPDIILLAGGTDGGAKNLPLELAELILQADPRPRFGETLRLPVIFAGNRDVGAEVSEILSSRFSFVEVDNLRPTLEREELTPARSEIHEMFLNHVMSHAPGYAKLLSWTPVPVLPTPGAVGNMVQQAAAHWNIQVLAVDIGGATTDVFSVFFSRDEQRAPVYNRTVSANLGMSYSIGNVLQEAGEDGIARWLPFSLSREELRDRLRNKMIRPTSIPYTLEDLLVEQAVCREALRLSFWHHRRLATGLRGAKRKRGFAEMFAKTQGPLDLVDMRGLDLIIGSGGVLSHAPNRRSAALMLIDAYQPEGLTRLAVDSIFMMPHLGVFASVHPQAAAEIFVRDCLINLGVVLAPTGIWSPGQEIGEVAIEGKGEHKIIGGTLKVVPLAEGERCRLRARPKLRGVDLGMGLGKEIEREVVGGPAGIILDGRGRPLVFASDEQQRLEQVRSWYSAMELSTQ